MTLKSVQELRELEDLCETLTEGSSERKKLEKLILGRKRELKGQAEALVALIDLCDKAAIPLGAVMPGAVTILVSTGVLDDPRKIWFFAGSVLGGLLWATLRVLAYRTTITARLELAQIGKVD